MRWWYRWRLRRWRQILTVREVLLRAEIRYPILTLKDRKALVRSIIRAKSKVDYYEWKLHL